MITHRLRQETHPLHLEVENVLNLAGRSWSLPTITNLLTRFYGFYSPWETQVWNQLGMWNLEPLFQGRQKTPSLEHDIQALTAQNVDFQHIPRWKGGLDFFDVPTLLGSMYVIEGSTLGGQLIARQLEQVPGVAADHISFFRCYGDDVGKMWREFQNVLQTHATSKQAEDAMIDSANKTFAELAQWLKGI
ncbi:MAG TPA: biliverdin-producing heme oxygenase [Tepidisphaeraceae bacterium]|jgi:heme oxygenase|nr:biliverdin-producing heme oxygenase [Tepidisphaeraceae bacterium]